MYRLLIILILGAATTIATSWLLAAWLISDATERIAAGFTASEQPAWLIQKQARFGATATMATAFPGGYKPSFELMYRSMGLAEDKLRLSLPVTAEDPGQRPINYRYRIDQFGWPFRAMEATRYGTFDMATHLFIQAEHAGGIKLSPAGESIPFPWQDRVLPLKPLWVGFICNTFIYAVAWLLALRLFSALRGYRRFLKGVCPKCAYQLNFDFRDGCAECGWRRQQRLAAM